MTVYVTPFAWDYKAIGVWHVTDACPRLWRSRRLRQVTVADAQAHGLEECRWCGARQCQHERRERAPRRRRTGGGAA